MCFLFLLFGGLFYEENEDVLPKKSKEAPHNCVCGNGAKSL